MRLSQMSYGIAALFCAMSCVSSEDALNGNDSSSDDESLSEESAEVIGFTSVLRNRGSGQCLDGFSAAGGAGAAPYQFTCNAGNTYQRWRLISTSSSSGLTVGNLQNEGTGLCLDGFGNTPYLWPCNTGNTYQRWFYSSGGAMINQQTLKCLDGFGNSPYQFTCQSGNNYQRWNES
jgi:Ricin-type beta-trefoil lectin domain